MLRALVVLLLVANVLAFAWHRGWVAAAPAAARLEQQVHPERLQLLGQQAATQLSRLACIEIGPLDGDDALRRTTATLTAAGFAASAWQTQSSELGGTWALATIKMPSKEFQARKEETYKAARIAFEPLPGFPDEQPTLVLSKHESEGAAQAALDAMNKRNYKGLRVLRLQAPRSTAVVRLGRIDGLQLSKLEAIANPPWGGARRSCEVTAASSGSASGASAASAVNGAGSAASTPASR